MKIFNLIITTKKKEDDLIIACMESLDKANKLSAFAAINPVIHDLEKLRSDTWNQDKITHIQNWLKANFKLN